MFTKHKEKQFQLRDPISHDWQCDLLAGPLHSEHSVTYGINERSVLNDIEYFHFADFGCLPQNVVHVLFEGVAPTQSICRRESHKPSDIK